MQESTVYQMIIERGIERGIEQALNAVLNKVGNWEQKSLLLTIY